jgi:hypothetical protein
VGSFGKFRGASLAGEAGAKVGSFGEFWGVSLAGVAGALGVAGVGAGSESGEGGSKVGWFGGGGVFRRMWMFLKARWRMLWRRAS